MEDVFIRYLHFIGIFILFSSILIEHLYLKKLIAVHEIKKLAVIDLAYGISAGIVLITGFSLWLWVGKPSEFYSVNPVFYIKISLFFIAALISIYPTIFFIRARRSASPIISVPKTVIMIVRMEILLLLIIPLLAVLMAKGYGLA
jgi:putative membrane protein